VNVYSIFDVLTAVVTGFQVCWNVTLCRLIHFFHVSDALAASIIRIQEECHGLLGP
jgi:hypothetical protein